MTSITVAHLVYAPVRQTEEQRQAVLETFAQRLRTLETETPIVVGDY